MLEGKREGGFEFGEYGIIEDMGIRVGRYFIEVNGFNRWEP